MGFFDSFLNNKPKQTDFLPNAPELGSDFFGGESGFIKENLKGTIGSGGMSEFLQQMLIGGKKDIGRKARTAREGIRESGASSGFRGANVNMFQDLFAEEASQVGKLEVGVGGLAQQRESEAVGRLIGVNQFEGGQELSKARLEEMSRQFDVTSEEGRRQFEKMFGLKEKELDAMLDAQGGDFLSVLGNIVGTGAGIVTGGAFGGLASGVGNIFEGFFKPKASPPISKP